MASASAAGGASRFLLVQFRVQCSIPATLPASSLCWWADHAAHRNGRAACLHTGQGRERAQLTGIMAQTADNNGRAVRHSNERRSSRGRLARAEVTHKCRRGAICHTAQLHLISLGRALNGGVVGVVPLSSMRHSRAHRGSRMIRAFMDKFTSLKGKGWLRERAGGYGIRPKKPTGNGVGAGHARPAAYPINGRCGKAAGRRGRCPLQKGAAMYRAAPSL